LAARLVAIARRAFAFLRAVVARRASVATYKDGRARNAISATTPSHRRSAQAAAGALLDDDLTFACRSPIPAGAIRGREHGGFSSPDATTSG
jgi:hypothetical protein